MSNNVNCILPQEKYNIIRKDFSVVQANDVNYFKSILGDDRVLTEEDEVLPFNIDWIKNCRGKLYLTSHRHKEWIGKGR